MKTKHGHSKGRVQTRAYKAWANMKSRCLNPNWPQFANYGGRGIAVCERWLDFTNFLSDMGEPLPGLTLDRVSNDGPYSPDNCRWTSVKEQQRNRRANVVVEIDGRKATVAEWAEELGVNPATVYVRIFRGMEPREALLTPLQRGARTSRWKGVTRHKQLVRKKWSARFQGKSLGFFHHECDAAMAYNEAAYAALSDWAVLNEAPQWEVECG